MKRLRVTRDAARKLVEYGTQSVETALDEFEPAICSWTPPLEARPARLQTDWTQSSAGLWVATACFLVGDELQVDTSFVFDVCCPTATSKPAGEATSWRFWAIWRGRWESLQHEASSAAECEKYVAGLGIEIGAHSAELGGRPITNVGVRAVRISGSSYEAKGGPLNLASNHFQWRTSSLSGETEAYLKTHRVSVVTDIVNGSPVKKTIEVVGAD